MDAIITGEIVKAALEGNASKAIGYAAIFLFIWIEVRGLKNEVKKLNGTIAKGFAEGETRFETIEVNQKLFEHRLVVLERTKGAPI